MLYSVRRVKLTIPEIMLLQLCVEYRQRDYERCEEMYAGSCAREYYDRHMSEMSDILEKLSEVL